MFVFSYLEGDIERNHCICIGDGFSTGWERKKMICLKISRKDMMVTIYFMILSMT